jgi:hypothetical protein
MKILTIRRRTCRSITSKIFSETKIFTNLALNSEFGPNLIKEMEKEFEQLSKTSKYELN